MNAAPAAPAPTGLPRAAAAPAGLAPVRDPALLAPVETAINRSEAGLRMMGLLMLAAVGLNLVFAWLALNPPEPRYLATVPAKVLEDGSSQKLGVGLNPLSQQLLTGAQAQRFAAEAVTTAFNFDFGNATAVQESMRGYFTAEAWEKYQSALDAGFLEEVVTRKQILTTIVEEDPLIVNEGPWNGRYTWTIEMMVMMNITTGGSPVTRRHLVTVQVAEIPLAAAKCQMSQRATAPECRSLAIERFIFGFGSNVSGK